MPLEASAHAATRRYGLPATWTRCFTDLTLLAAGCTPAPRTAAYRDLPGGGSVAIELYRAHPTLTGYDRVLLLATDTSGTRRHRPPMDTGSDATASLYACRGHRLMFDGDGEVLTLDTASAGIGRGACTGLRRYLGVVDGAGSRPWRFFGASERREQALVMRGG